MRLICVLNTRTSKHWDYIENSLLKYLSLNACQWLTGLSVGRYGCPINYNLLGIINIIIINVIIVGGK